MDKAAIQHTCITSLDFFAKYSLWSHFNKFFYKHFVINLWRIDLITKWTNWRFHQFLGKNTQVFRYAMIYQYIVPFLNYYHYCYWKLIIILAVKICQIYFDSHKSIVWLIDSFYSYRLKISMLTQQLSLRIYMCITYLLTTCSIYRFSLPCVDWVFYHALTCFA